MKCAPLQRVSRWLAGLADIAGTGASLALLALTVGIICSIGLRRINIDNEWTYDLVLFSMMWTAMVGAAFTAIRDLHVTAGIALENMTRGRAAAIVLGILRFLIIATFLVLLIGSGYRQAANSLANHKTTLDIPKWPVWIAQAAIPIGGIAWLAAEAAKVLKKIGA
jgi:TRAP-type C4-dicarboxylate transport system permease small subunit